MRGLSRKLSAENFSTQGIGGGSFGAVAAAHPFVLHQSTVRKRLDGPEAATKGWTVVDMKDD